MLSILVAVLLTVMIVLAIPLTLNYEFSWKGSLHGELNLHWLFGLIRIRIPASRLSTRHKNKKQIKKAKKNKEKGTHDHSEHKKTSTVRYIARGLRIVTRSEVKQRISKFVQSFWRSVDKRDVKMQLRLGLGDPADTGMLWVILGPISALLNSVRDASIVLEPEFQESTLDFRSSGAITIVPLRSLWLVVSFALSPVLWLAFFRSWR